MKLLFPKQNDSCSVSQFLHSYICEKFIYFQDRSACSAAGKYVDFVDQSWEYINRSHMNVEIGIEAAQFPEKEYINGIFLTMYERDVEKASRELHRASTIEMT
jgi:hypothetical protein